MTEELTPPDWLKVLLALYESQIATIDLPIQGSLAVDPNNPAYSETDLEVDEFNEAMSFLRDTGLVEIPQSDHYIITGKGFSVVHDWKQRQQQTRAETQRSKRQNNVNRIIGYLTLGLVAISAINAVASSVASINSTGVFFGFSYESWSIIVALLSILVAIGIGIEAVQSGILNPYNPEEIREDS
ncbi:hypothetical protein [Natrinema salsiterrestre]|uniref:Uncharacterized protein n=1 Tax=Natrinema salsiterrestre TaxID=2950540 RepID=A0A9Q4L387_9EURY|nr:hypothetical protein [Natrinema salsiterrestre]MDF9744521.1 hypothetical protein [Natrinema salsiterrestre]